MQHGNSTYPPIRHEVELPLKICVGVTSCLSIIGSFLIILTFCFGVFARHPSSISSINRTSRSSWKRLLSPGRLIIVNLSIADILLATSHLWGVADNYERYFHRNQRAHDNGPDGSTDAECDAQGALAVYGTLASFLWTITLSFFVVGTLILPRPKLYGHPLALVIYSAICWGLPAIVLSIVAAKRAFGLDEENAIAWCYILPWSKSDDTLMNIIAYNMWSYLTILLLLLFFFVTIFYTCCRGKKRLTVTEATALVDSGTFSHSQFPHHQKSFKLIFVALILVILRMWDAIYVSLPYYQNYDKLRDSSDWIVVLVFLAGIGNSAQGFANAILFLLLTKTFRTWIVNYFRSCCRSERTQTN